MIHLSAFERSRLVVWWLCHVFTGIHLQYLSISCTVFLFLFCSKKYKDVLWQSKEQRKTEWSKIDAVKKAGLELDALINPLKTGIKPIWSEEAKK